MGARLISTPKESPQLCELAVLMSISDLGDDVGMLRTCHIRVWVTENACPFFAVLPHRFVFVRYVGVHFSMHACIIIRVVSGSCCFCRDVSEQPRQYDLDIGSLPSLSRLLTGVVHTCPAQGHPTNADDPS